MQFYRDGNVLKVVRITGPQHNFLCLEIASGKEAEPAKIEALPIPPGEVVSIEPNDVLREVKTGLCDASARLGIRVTAKRIQFLPSDSPPVEIYRSMAEALIVHFAQECFDT